MDNMRMYDRAAGRMLWAETNEPYGEPTMEVDAVACPPEYALGVLLKGEGVIEECQGGEHFEVPVGDAEARLASGEWVELDIPTLMGVLREECPEYFDEIGLRREDDTMGTIKVNMLGDTPEGQWKNAISLYEVAIRSNTDEIRSIARDADFLDGESLEDAMRELTDRADAIDRIAGNILAELGRVVGVERDEDEMER